MIWPQRYFPWRVAREFFVAHVVFTLVALGSTALGVRYYVKNHLLVALGTKGPVHEQALQRLDGYLLSIFLVVFVIGGVFFLLTTRHYSHPLGRMIQRARELRKMDGPLPDEALDEDEIVSEEPGEWFDLERALGLLHRDLRLKTDELTREREELAALLGAVSDAILAIDRNGEPLFYNSQFAILFRSAKGASRPVSLIETFRVPEVLNGYREVLESGQEKAIAASLRTVSHDLVRHFSISIAPLRGRDGGEVYGAVGVFHDVTELKQSEQVRIDFVANASHELRTPLTSLKGYVATLRDDLKAGRLDDAGKFVDILSRNVDRMIALVSDLLDLSALDSGAALQKTVVATREVTEAVLRALEGKRSAKRIEIQTHFEAESLVADPHRVEQVLMNLVHNAIKYVPEDRKIDIFWDAEGDTTHLRVKDNGPGIGLEHQSRLFERFYRVDAGRSREAGGTGLGLSIVKHIMLKHGGSVRLESRPSQGSEFICTFP